MPIDESAMSAAIMGAVKEESAPPPADDPPEGEIENTEGEGNDSATNDPNGDGSNDGSDEESGKPAGADSGGTDDGKVDKPDGGKAPVAKPAGEPDPKATKAGEKPGEKPAAKPAKEPDAVNDPIPPNLKDTTRERMVKLIDTAKDLTQKLDTRNQEFETLYGAIADTQATPEQYGGALQYLKLINSPKPEDKKKALSIMVEEVRALSAMLGEPVPGMDALEGHADLTLAVQQGSMTREHAEELALSRNQRQFQTASASKQNQDKDAATNRATAVRNGITALNELEQTLSVDPQFAQKRAILVQTLKPVLATLPPDKWASTFQAAYRELKVQAPPPPPPPPPPPRTAVPVNQPMRANKTAVTAGKAPGSMEEAIRASLTGG